jgi:Rps23 Pro-64 3,4-dihydroxylase Tpa1-like proline 4-hydroxylase
MQTPHLHVDGFLPAAEAEALRGDFDRHFAEPDRHTAEQHQIWNYWHVPPIYTYLRTSPQKVIADDRIKHFHARLSAWARETLGMSRVTWPNLSLYIDGCLQGLHNDSVNGRFGYVFSLTRNERRTTGGETIVLREGDLFRSNLGSAAAGVDLYDLIAPRFNRLAIFDDRMPHGVQRVEGSMDPVEGRIVLHGHISEGGAFAKGALPPAEVVAQLGDPVRRAMEGLGQGYHGPLVLRVSIAADGKVRETRILVNRMAHAENKPADELVARIMGAVEETVFNLAEGDTEATIPFTFGRKVG